MTKLSLQTWLKRLVAGIAVIATIAALIVYVDEAGTRHARLPACEWTDDPNPLNLPYIATWCLLTKDMAVIRVYGLSRSRLLAERTYSELDTPRLFWDSDALGYLDGSSDGGRIALPPTLLDRVRAKFP